ncbi:hypothetical protein BCU85_15535 [Vibrio lentus]|uniref:DUF2787 domain-containing protein n=2 Tax=Vibrionaceae TaxID=641 RepID=A0A2T5EGS7_VIBSP|nr:hypothetical protein A162_23180 [Vibrio tasmaniensis 1F-155]PMG73209.1 hypothetical protein BCU85_15535 [Vibrio lentus]PTP18864.1 DUF2787 domain-containing protein [Vibrio splendidus]PMK91103.1 hypothetical protein BCT88_02390 [Vibrio lentus]PML22136.1 hypothetical protein BCT80_09160 [Vibrio lentus]
MNKFSISGLNDELVSPMHCFLGALMSENVIPNTVERVALNIRSKDINSRFQPIEIQLERTSSKTPWQLRFIATFDVMVTGKPQKELSLYFNFARCWFYHPEIKQCNLQRPEVQALLASWLKTITHTVITQPAISINITSVR